MIMLLVKERMNPRLITIHPEGSLAEARSLLDRHRIRHLPVIEDGKLLGILTDRDIRSASSLTRLEQVKVVEAMTGEVVTVSPETWIQEAAKLMLTHRIGCLPVLEGGALQGIITETDLLNALVEVMDHAVLERIAPDYQHRTMTVIDL